MLFDERDLMLEIWKESSDRISKLEDFVRQLTLHMLNNPSSPTPSPVATQRLPVQTTNGQNVEQSVPRGMKFTINGGKEIRSPIRSFTPGEQWWTRDRCVHLSDGARGQKLLEPISSSSWQRYGACRLQSIVSSRRDMYSISCGRQR